MRRGDKKGRVVEYHPCRITRILFEGVSTRRMTFLSLPAVSYEMCTDQVGVPDVQRVGTWNLVCCSVPYGGNRNA